MKSGKMKRVPKYFLPPSLKYTKLALVGSQNHSYPSLYGPGRLTEAAA